MANAQATIQQMQGVIAVLQQQLTDITQETVNLRTLVAQNRAAVEALTATSTQSWSTQTARIDSIETELGDAQEQIHRNGSGGGGAGDPKEPKEWNLLHKGDVDKYNGDRKQYRQWSRKLAAFANSKKAGFRKALKWAEKLAAPITSVELSWAQQQWEHTEAANTKLYDLLVQVCTGDALSKVETTVGEEQGFEAWRRLARQYEPTSRLTKVEKLNSIMNTTTCSSMRDMLGKIEVWEQAWAKYELDHSQKLDTDLKLGALLTMLPVKEREVVKLKYVQDEAGLTYDVLRRQVEYWLESVQASSASNAMELSALSPDDIAKMNETQLEEALDILRKGGKGSKGKTSTKGDRSGNRTPRSEDKDKDKKIRGKCWTCGKEGHTAAACRSGLPPKKGLESLENGEEEEDEDSEGEQGPGMNGLSIACLSYADHLNTPEDDDVDGIPDPFFDPSLCYCCEDCESEPDMLAFSGVDSDDDDSDDEEKTAMAKTIQQELESKRAIAAENIGIEKASSEQEWKQPQKTAKVVAEIRGNKTPLTEVYKNPFEALASSSSDADIEPATASKVVDLAQPVDLMDTLKKRLEAASASAIPSPNTSFSGTSSYKFLSAIGQAAPIHHRLNDSIESPPGIESIPPVIVRISGASDEDIIVIGKVVPDLSILARDQPLSISSPAPTEIEKADSNTSIELAETCEAVDCVGFDSDDALFRRAHHHHNKNKGTSKKRFYSTQPAPGL